VTDGKTITFYSAYVLCAVYDVDNNTPLKVTCFVGLTSTHAPVRMRRGGFKLSAVTFNKGADNKMRPAHWF